MWTPARIPSPDPSNPPKLGNCHAPGIEQQPLPPPFEGFGQLLGHVLSLFPVDVLALGLSGRGVHDVLSGPETVFLPPVDAAFALASSAHVSPPLAVTKL
jgi:hypothetical protein